MHQSTPSSTLSSPTISSLQGTSLPQVLTFFSPTRAHAPPQKATVKQSSSSEDSKQPRYTLTRGSKSKEVAHPTPHTVCATLKGPHLEILTDYEDEVATPPLKSNRPSQKLTEATPQKLHFRHKGATHSGFRRTPPSSSGVTLNLNITGSLCTGPHIKILTDYKDGDIVTPTPMLNLNSPPQVPAHPTPEEPFVSVNLGGTHHAVGSVVQTTALDPTLTKIQAHESTFELSGTFPITYLLTSGSPPCF